MKKMILFLLTICCYLQAQPAEIMNAAEIKLGIKKLGVLGSVLYLAAHPDDENTAILTYYAKGMGYRAAYLSLTRGRGGQNLIGLEKSALMSVLRTSELQQARHIDGAEQFFTRAIDFGYSKNPQETFLFWNKDSVLKDVVRVIRTFKPDIIINRFPVSGGGHGHHTASAILSVEAFQLAGDSDYLPSIPVWQPKRVFWNSWRPRGRSGTAQDTQGLFPVDVGSYNPLLGKSYTEISALSRSQHKTQGFGARAYRGSNRDYLQLVAGEKAVNDPFEGIDTSWKRVTGSNEIGALIKSLDLGFNPEQPYASIQGLIGLYKKISRLEPSYWVRQKKEEIKRLIQSCAGLWLEAIAEDHAVTPGDLLPVTLSLLNRSITPIALKKISFSLSMSDSTTSTNLKTNEALEILMKLAIPENTPFSNPYWLEGGFVTDQLYVYTTIDISGTEFTYQIPLLYRWTDRVKGEQYRSLEVIPPVMMNFAQPVYLFNGSKDQHIAVHLKSGRDKVSGSLRLDLPDSWRSAPQHIDFSFTDKYEEQTHYFTLSSDHEETRGPLRMQASINGKEYNRGYYEMNYDHIPKRTVFPVTESQLVKLNLNKKGHAIGYIMGAGDDIPPVLEQLGYQVTLLDENNLDNSDLSQFDAVITGIRAYNTNDRLVTNYEKMMRYVETGGTLIVQYSTTWGLLTDQIGPYAFSIGRGRVTREEAPVTFTDPAHTLLNYPNKITNEDFQEWIQERGLYFAGEWDDRYQTVLSCNDPGENGLKGGLLYARYGKGVFIYTGYSWFRQMPAGVPGAIRLFVNLISAGGKE
jgi:LmbE family N-acetylglucosaminyl deacetylase